MFKMKTVIMPKSIFDDNNNTNNNSQNFRNKFHLQVAHLQK